MIDIIPSNKQPIRVAIYSFVLAFVLGVYILIHLTLPSSSTRFLQLDQTYALTAALLLYITLLITPLYEAFPKLPGRGQAILARRALGISAWAVSLLHTYTSFTKLLGGFTGLHFLSSVYIIAVSLGALALVILFILAIISTEESIRRLGFNRWKYIHRFVYVAAWLVVIHAVLIGSHYTTPDSEMFRLSFIAIGFLLILESLRFDRFLHRTIIDSAGFGPVSLLTASAITVGFAYFLPFSGHGTNSTIGIHSGHTAAQTSSGTIYLQITPATLAANQEGALDIELIDPSGKVITPKSLLGPLTLSNISSAYSAATTLSSTQITAQIPAVSAGDYRIYLSFIDQAGQYQTLGSSITVGQ